MAFWRVHIVYPGNVRVSFEFGTVLVYNQVCHIVHHVVNHKVCLTAHHMDKPYFIPYGKPYGTWEVFDDKRLKSGGLAIG